MCHRCEVHCECWRHTTIGPGSRLGRRRKQRTPEEIKRLVEEALKQAPIASPAAERAARKRWGDGES